MYKFIKDHLDNKAGDEIKDHPNLHYLIRVGVIEAKQKPAPAPAPAKKTTK